MRTLRFQEYGDPLAVLRLEDEEAPRPGPGQIRIAVEACGLTPADWALCSGLFPGDLPRGIGLEVAGTVDDIGTGVTGTTIGDGVIGPAPYAGRSAGASDFALLDTWVSRPSRLDPIDAAALPMAVETAYRGLDDLGVREGTTVLVHGAGTTVGYAAVQIALGHGAKVIAAAGRTYSDALRGLGAEVTPYGDGIADRVRAIAGGPVDVVLDTAPVSDALPGLVQTVSAPSHVLTLSDIASADKLGVRTSAGQGNTLRYDVLGEYVQRAAEGTFTVPVARTFPLTDWAAAAELSLSGHAHGKLVLRIA